MKIAIITSGGDAPGMNAAIRAVVRSALSSNIEIIGFHRGYQGILDDDYVELNRQSVSNIIQTGGTFLKTDRCEEFTKLEARLKAGEVLKKHGVDGLVVIGGDGSFRGAADLTRDTGINVVGVPGTIDNDLAYTDYTLGFTTAVNNVLWAINSLRDTMQSHDKVTFVEVMGRHCGDIALHVGVTGGAEYIIVPEVPFDIIQIAKEIQDDCKLGKRSNLIVVAEGAEKIESLAEKFTNITGIKPRLTRLGFIQRGGSPSYLDRLLACKFGVKAVEVLKAGETNKVVGIKNNQVIVEDIYEALSKKKVFDMDLYNIANKLK